MVRAASVRRREIPLSYHSDLPICASDPLAMASWGVNRVTHSGRVAGPDQRISRDEALRAVTIEAAYSWQREHDLGSVEVGKWANLTVLDDDPYEVETTDIASIRVIATMFQGRWHRVPLAHADQRVRGHRGAEVITLDGSMPGHSPGHLCGCEVASYLSDIFQGRTAISA